MNQLEERRYYEEEDEIDLYELLHTILKYKVRIAVITILVAIIATLGGYIYNKANTVTTAIIGFNYPELEKGKNPDGSIFSRGNIISLDVINETFGKYKEDMKVEDLDEFRNSILIEPIIPESTQTLIDNALKRGENYSFTASNYLVTLKEKNKEVLTKLVSDSVEKYIKKYKPTYYIQRVKSDIFDYDYGDSYLLLDERVKMMEMLTSSYTEKDYMSKRLGYSFGMLSEKLKNFKNVELQDYYSYYMINGFSKIGSNKLVRIDSNIQKLKLENQALEGKVKVFKEMLENLKPAQKQLIVPTIQQEGINVNDQNDYYPGLVAEYVKLNNNIEDNKIKIKLLEESKMGIKTPTAEETAILDKKLKTSVEKLNKIIEDMNMLNEEYTNSTYSDMIKVMSPVTTTTEGKPLLLFLGVGLVIGLMLGVFSAFMKEFVKQYKHKYSK